MSRAAEGDHAAFDTLYTDHVGAAWRLAYALTGTTTDATTAVSTAFTRSFTALRAEWAAATTRFETLLLTNVRNGAMDLRAEHEAPPPFESGRDDIADLAVAFAALPERWRAALWLTEVEGLGMRTTAAVVDVARNEVGPLVSRARRGLRETWLHAATATGTARTCRRALGRLTGHVEGRLPADEVEKVERHLRLCDMCRARHDRLDDIMVQLAWLAPAAPAQLAEETRGAWLGLFAAEPTGFGLSAFAERVLAGVTAAAAAVGVFGATLAAGSASSRSEQMVAPIAPIVTELATPRPADIDLGITLDREAPAPVGGTPVDAADAADSSTDDIIPAGTDGDTTAGPTDSTDSTASNDGGQARGERTPSTEPTDNRRDTNTSTPPTSDPGTDTGASSEPALSVGTNVGDTPVAVEVGENPGVTVGPVSVGSRPQPGGGTLDVGGALDGLDDVVEPVDDTVTGLLDNLGG